jgi:hypothetical protein
MSYPEYDACPNCVCTIEVAEIMKCATCGKIQCPYCGPKNSGLNRVSYNCIACGANRLSTIGLIKIRD